MRALLIALTLGLLAGYGGTAAVEPSAADVESQYRDALQILSLERQEMDRLVELRDNLEYDQVKRVCNLKAMLGEKNRVNATVASLQEDDEAAATRKENEEFRVYFEENMDALLAKQRSELAEQDAIVEAQSAKVTAAKARLDEIQKKRAP